MKAHSKGKGYPLVKINVNALRTSMMEEAA